MKFALLSQSHVCALLSEAILNTYEIKGNGSSLIKGEIFIWDLVWENHCSSKYMELMRYKECLTSVTYITITT